MVVPCTCDVSGPNIQHKSLHQQDVITVHIFSSIVDTAACCSNCIEMCTELSLNEGHMCVKDRHS